ncbi:MAG: hypothetical protein R3C49_09555 [Planctomycetaceae bacterium]
MLSQASVSFFALRTGKRFSWPSHAAAPTVFTIMILAVSVGVDCRAQMPAGTQPLTVEGDIASLMVDGIDRFLLAELQDAELTRPRFWNPATVSLEAFQQSVQPNRDRLATMLGVRDARLAFSAPDIVATVDQPSGMIGGNEKFDVYQIRWPVLADPARMTPHLASVAGEGLLLVPKDKILANVIAAFRMFSILRNRSLGWSTVFRLDLSLLVA